MTKKWILLYEINESQRLQLTSAKISYKFNDILTNVKIAPNLIVEISLGTRTEISTFNQKQETLLKVMFTNKLHEIGDTNEFN